MPTADSRSQFSPLIEVSSTETITDVQTFTASGELETDRTSTEIRQVHVFVIIEQTAQDRGSGTGTKATAKGYKLVEGEAASLTTWSVDMTVLPGPGFISGSATGTALTVEYTDDPVGFETYIWTSRLKINLKGQAPST